MVGPAPIPHLPSEIWLMVLECLPPSFFQQDIGRLAVSKRWYSLAFPAFYPRIEFTPRVISRLVHRKSPAMDETRAMLRKSLRCVDIVLDGLPEQPPALPDEYEPDTDLVCFNTPANLVRFSVMLLEYRELKTVRFAARWPNRAWPADPLQTDYLNIRSLQPYLSVLTHITSLDLDLCGTDILGEDDGAAAAGDDDDSDNSDDNDNDNTDASSPIHFCNFIRPLLSRLTTLRLRMRSICALALQPLAGRPVTVRNLSLSLYLGRVSENNPKLNASRMCPRLGLRGFTRNVSLLEMQSAMRELIEDMPVATPVSTRGMGTGPGIAPGPGRGRRAEIVHLAPSGEVHVWDAATDVCVRDVSVEPMRLPLCFEAKLPDTPCFLYM
ncbi:hypothetical protein B0J18DRAFT_202974 [Chaetomium sp. MPI-SDFR-AT-0129]|nr:hypothetical protein B0J18DRAFT_202974 [Chaetomium sp. MPI-SDFR-AT-0129]